MRGVFAGLDAHVELKGIIGTHLLEGFAGVGIEVKNLNPQFRTQFTRGSDIWSNPCRTAAHLGRSILILEMPPECGIEVAKTSVARFPFTSAAKPRISSL